MAYTQYRLPPRCGFTRCSGVKVNPLVPQALESAAQAPGSSCLSAKEASSRSLECVSVFPSHVPGVMHWFICHLPVADQSSSVFLVPVHLPALSLFCHRPSSNSAPFWHPRCTEHGIFCIFSVFRYSVKLFLSFVELTAPSEGHQTSLQKFRVTAGSGMVFFFP